MYDLIARIQATQNLQRTLHNRANVERAQLYFVVRTDDGNLRTFRAESMASLGP